MDNLSISLDRCCMLSFVFPLVRIPVSGMAPTPPLTLLNFHVMFISLVMVCSFNLDHLVLRPLFVVVVVFRVVFCAFFVPHVSWLLVPVIDEVLVMGASVVVCVFLFPYGF